MREKKQEIILVINCVGGIILPDMPDLRQPESVSTDLDLGPRVPTILVNAGKKLCVKNNTSKERDQRYSYKSKNMYE